MIACHLSDHSQGTLFHAGNHQHIQWENIWPHCQRVNTQGRWRLQGFLASVKGRWDHSKGTLLPAGWPQWERWPVWDLTSLEKMERTVPSLYHKFPASVCVSALCFHIHMCTTCADVCIGMRLHTISFLFVYYAVMFACVWVAPAFFFVLSTVCTKWTTYHTKAKSWRRLFHMAKRLHNMILSVLCTHPHTHKTWLQMEGGATRAHTILSLSLPCLLKHTLSMCRPTAQTQTYTCTHSPVTPPPHCRRQAGPSVPRGRETERQRKRSVDPVMCVLFTPQPPVLSLSSSSFSPVPSSKFSSLSAPLAVLWIHKQTFFPSLSAPLSVRHAGYTFVHTAVTCKTDACRLVLMSKKLKSMRRTQWSESVSAVSPSACWIIHLHELQDYTLTLKMSSEKCIQPQGHQDNPEEHTHSQMKYSTWWSIQTGSRPYLLFPLCTFVLVLLCHCSSVHMVLTVLASLFCLCISFNLHLCACSLLYIWSCPCVHMRLSGCPWPCAFPSPVMHRILAGS